MSIATVVTQGFGPGGSPSAIVLLGFWDGIPTPSTTGSSGGRYYRYIPSYTECSKEIKTLEKEKKQTEQKIAKLEVQIDDKQDSLKYEESMNTIKLMVEQLTKMQKQLDDLRANLLQIEDEEMQALALCINEWLH